MVTFTSKGADLLQYAVITRYQSPRRCCITACCGMWQAPTTRLSEHAVATLLRILHGGIKGHR